MRTFAEVNVGIQTLSRRSKRRISRSHLEEFTRGQYILQRIICDGGRSCLMYTSG